MYKRLIISLLLSTLILTACGVSSTAAPPEATAQARSETVTPPVKPTTEAASITTPSETAVPEGVERPSWASATWETNFARHSVAFDEIMSGGVGRDGIPSIDAPQFVSHTAAQEWLAANEPVVVLEINGAARAYPLQILTWHEIVNDTIGDVPVAVTFCPLCNSAIVFDRRVEGEVYEFGVSGLLRNSDLVMYDRTSESLWQQFTGEAIIGDLTGAQLTFLPSSLVSFADFQAAYPEGMVLSRDTGFNRRYGVNPYTNYDATGGTPFLFDGKIDERLPAMERVVAVTHTVTDDSTVDIAYPFSQLAEQGVVNDTEHTLVVFHLPGTSSALGASQIAEGEDVGATGVFDPRLDDQLLTFRREGTTIVDQQTGSTWNVLGQATSGAFAGRQLTPIIHGNHFWFAWVAFHPDTLVHRP